MRTSTAIPAVALAAALALVPGNAPAAGAMTIGLKGGLSVATLHGRLPTDALLQNGTRLGAGGGVSLTLRLGERLSLQPEVLYVSKGTSLGKVELPDSSGISVGTAEVLEVIDYLEIPILARISLSSGGLASPYLLAGPAVGVRLSQQLRVTGDASFATDLDFFSGTDIGFALGAGLELGRGRTRWSFETRYTLGLTPATANSYSDNARNGDLLVMAGLAIHR